MGVKINQPQLSPNRRSNRASVALLTALLCSANTFADEDSATDRHKVAADSGAHEKLAAANDPQKKIPRNALFDQLIGTWDVRYEIFDKDGKVRRDRGQVRYSWILDGKALQEIWSSASESTDSQPFGTTIDFYDLKRQRWTAVWIYPAQGMTSMMSGGEVNGSFVLTGHNESGALERWSTSITSPDSIAVRADVSDDDGKTWRPMGVSYLQGHRK
jgi:hypothetical protein